MIISRCARILLRSVVLLSTYFVVEGMAKPNSIAIDCNVVSLIAFVDLDLFHRIA